MASKEEVLDLLRSATALLEAQPLAEEFFAEVTEILEGCISAADSLSDDIHGLRTVDVEDVIEAISDAYDAAQRLHMLLTELHEAVTGYQPAN